MIVKNGHVNNRRRVVVTGTRRCGFDELADRAARLLLSTDIVCVGGASGIDNFIEAWCHDIGIDLFVCPALWEAYGKYAGPRRNRLMLDVFKPDLVIAVPVKGSRGTWDCVNAAKERGIEVVLIAEEEK